MLLSNCYETLMFIVTKLSSLLSGNCKVYCYETFGQVMKKAYFKAYEKDLILTGISFGGCGKPDSSVSTNQKICFQKIC